jgi:hypothetical protein
MFEVLLDILIIFSVFTILSIYFHIKKAKKWDYFNQKLLKYSDEIKDSNTKFCFLINVSIWTLGKAKSKKEQKLFEKEILSKYISHIPSLKKEIRNEKIINLLK